ncbi:hypothetical protein SELMODRAFT_408891 [Selaginella moellendorffii]|uniref:Transmembrane protein n=1 Tax=Selaginella moellendorffii TaxID=88036 RepID=D8RA99_SELML|nr:hypothetical protein SELMODRAFT_408891 [Selaginella moellendorffii]
MESASQRDPQEDAQVVEGMDQQQESDDRGEMEMMPTKALAKTMITPFTFVASTCFQTGISLIKPDATREERGRCFHLFLAGIISTVGTFWSVFLLIQRKRKPSEDQRRINECLFFLFFAGITTLVWPLIYSILTVLFHCPHRTANVIVSVCTGITTLYLASIIRWIAKLEKFLRRIKLPCSLFAIIVTIIFTVNGLGYMLYT